MSERLRIAITKGRLLDQSVELFERIRPAGWPPNILR